MARHHTKKKDKKAKKNTTPRKGEKTKQRKTNEGEKIGINGRKTDSEKTIQQKLQFSVPNNGNTQDIVLPAANANPVTPNTANRYAALSDDADSDEEERSENTEEITEKLKNLRTDKDGTNTVIINDQATNASTEQQDEVEEGTVATSKTDDNSKNDKTTEDKDQNDDDMILVEKPKANTKKTPRTQ